MRKSKESRIEDFKKFLDYRKKELEEKIKAISYSEALKNQYIGAIREIEIVQELMANDCI